MVLYFAYGSNLLTSRLRQRCPSAQPVGAASVTGFTQTLTKRSVDGSGKAALEPAAGASAFGALFDVHTDDLGALFAAESVGYHPVRSLEIRLLAGPRHQDCWSFIGIEEYLQPGLVPYDWYRDLMIAGSIEQGLPRWYTEALTRVETSEDPVPERPTRREALQVLRRAADSGHQPGGER